MAGTAPLRDLLLELHGKNGLFKKPKPWVDNIRNQ
ncbi:uncharacterized protein METZ01_LOCUS485523 [marine metagenome]|uniref:Uncharacterized protein n=1 Tax=marine metagenome TaxID=408172 RepID=A0A383CKU2_9ZZZZ